MLKRLFVLWGVVSLVVGGGALGWLWWTTQSRPSISTTELPPAPPLSEPAPIPRSASESPTQVEKVPLIVTPGVIDSGTLAIDIRGQRIGTEDYTLERRENGELVLRSQGELRFKIAWFDVKATFEQVITFTAQRRPMSYQVALDGPIGIGRRRINASFGTTTGTVMDGERRSELALAEEPFLVLGMFSSYAILPLWATPEAPQKLKVVTLRGDRRDVWVVLEYVGPVTLYDAQGNSFAAEEYLLKGERLTLKFYLSGERLLALHNDTRKDNERFLLYRHDIFADTFAVPFH